MKQISAKTALLEALYLQKLKQRKRRMKHKKLKQQRLPRLSSSLLLPCWKMRRKVHRLLRSLRRLQKRKPSLSQSLWYQKRNALLTRRAKR